MYCKDGRFPLNFSNFITLKQVGAREDFLEGGIQSIGEDFQKTPFYKPAD